MKINEHLAIARQDAGLSLRKLAAITGIPHATLSQVETGFVREPSFRRVVKIARALRVPLGRLAKAE